MLSAISEIDKKCQHICNLYMFCLPGKAGWAAWSVDFGHNFYYPFTYTFAIIILPKYRTKKKVKSWRQGGVLSTFDIDLSALFATNAPKLLCIAFAFPIFGNLCSLLQDGLRYWALMRARGAVMVQFSDSTFFPTFFQLFSNFFFQL